jgi:FKBP-type peptidyl-prolyl cis-trans isomerase SlyD
VASSAKDVIAPGKVVGFHYTLKSSTGTVLDKSEEDDPMLYLHGAENIVPGLERQMNGKKVGDKFNAEVAPAEGYGERQGKGPQPVPRAAFPEGIEIEAGAQFTAEGPDGELMPVWIAKVEADTVYVDRNHPLAGETLHFQIEVVSIRDATREETSHGHPHGPGGHHH